MYMFVTKIFCNSDNLEHSDDSENIDIVEPLKGYVSSGEGSEGGRE